MNSQTFRVRSCRLFGFGPACLHAQRNTSSSCFAHLAAFAWPGRGGRGPSRAASGESFYSSDYAVSLLGECFNNIGVSMALNIKQPGIQGHCLQTT